MTIAIKCVQLLKKCSQGKVRSMENFSVKGNFSLNTLAFSIWTIHSMSSHIF